MEKTRRQPRTIGAPSGGTEPLSGFAIPDRSLAPAVTLIADDPHSSVLSQSSAPVPWNHAGSNQKLAPGWEVEEEQEEYFRVSQRVQDAIDDPSGRLKLFVGHSNTPIIPEDVGRIRTLRELHMSTCRKVKRLPLTLTRLCDTLQVIDASHCNLESIPEELGALHMLRRLDFSDNKLTQFFWNPELLKNLEFLDLSRNKLRFLSYRTRGLLEQLLKIEQSNFKTQLNAQRTLNLDHNDFINPSEYSPKDWQLSQTPRQCPLSDMLPPHVDSCAFCCQVVEVGLPVVYVRFQYVIGPKLRKHITISQQHPSSQSPPAPLAALESPPGGGDQDQDGEGMLLPGGAGPHHDDDTMERASMVSESLVSGVSPKHRHGAGTVGSGSSATVSPANVGASSSPPLSLVAAAVVPNNQGGSFCGENLSGLMLTMGAEAGGENMAAPQRIPFFFPYCPKATCLAELHRILSIEKFAPRRI